MRPLTDEETKTMFEKLSKYIGENIKLLVDRPDGTYCFRLHNDRVYYMSEKILKLATNISRDKLVSVGTCFGKFTKTNKFRLHITALDFLAPYAKFKVWVKPGAEQSFLYGNHVLKSGLGRITENTMQYQGVVVYSMADMPLGFGVAAKSTQECRRVDPMSIVVFHQADSALVSDRKLRPAAATVGQQQQASQTEAINMVRRCEASASTARELKVAPFRSEYQKLFAGSSITKFTTNSAYSTRNQVMVAHTIPQLS
ncbi:hypothetical protein INR49_031751 [Caranx melampygus]|nr:hypothetical protein INR49_031751 [Caranx melampygus]